MTNNLQLFIFVPQGAFSDNGMTQLSNVDWLNTWFHNKIISHFFFSKSANLCSHLEEKSKVLPEIPFIYSGEWSMSKMIRTVIKQQNQIHR